MFNRDLYLVAAPGGACSAFVAALIYHWLADIPEVMNFGWHGSCHNEHEYAWVNNWNNLDWQAPDIFESGYPKDKSIPFVGRQHTPPNTELLKSLYPSHYTFNIIYDIDDIDLIGAFLFFKQEVWLFDNDIDKNWNRYNLEFNSSSPHDLSTSEIKTYTEKIITNRTSLQHRLSFSSILKEDPENSIVLEMSDMLRDKDKFLNIICNAIEKPITEHISLSYDKYIDANKNLIATKCPWIDYFKI